MSLSFNATLSPDNDTLPSPDNDTLPQQSVHNPESRFSWL